MRASFVRFVFLLCGALVMAGAGAFLSWLVIPGDMGAHTVWSAIYGWTIAREWWDKEELRRALDMACGPEQ